MRIDWAPLSSLDPASALLERSTALSAFACGYFLEHGIPYELREDGVIVTAADPDDPRLVALR